ncbi:hypothetical protein ACA910_019983 [Epithemia clementina (nom. ined.)]
MSETRFTIEFAKSGRSKCNKCKQPIQIKDMRIGSHSNNGEFEMSKWTHVGCFKLPRKYSTGANKMSAEEFVRSVLEDTTSENILSKNIDEVIEKIDEASSSTAKKGSRKSSGTAATEGGSGESPIAELKAAYEEEQKELADGTEPSSKRSKSNLAARLDAYGKYKDCKNAELQDILRYNRQILKGTKDFLLAKVVDGVVYGRLSRCALCGGQLKMKDDGKTVECGGSFDESTQRRIECCFTCAAEDAPRWQPWYETEPTEEEAQAMDDLIEQYKDAEGVPATMNGKGKEDQDAKKLIKAVAKINWDLTNNQGIKSVVNVLYEILSDKENSSKKLDLPDDPKQAKMKILETVNMNRDKSAEEMIPILIQEFGWAEAKLAKKAKKQAALVDAVACEANAAIVAALQELAELYFKEGNRNAGLSYNKAVAAIRDLSYEITEDNAKGLGKGKSKVANIGKGTAEKIHEFISTGTIAKLEEKRADAA